MHGLHSAATDLPAPLRPCHRQDPARVAARRLSFAAYTALALTPAAEAGAGSRAGAARRGRSTFASPSAAAGAGGHGGSGSSSSRWSEGGGHSGSSAASASWEALAQALEQRLAGAGSGAGGSGAGTSSLQGSPPELAPGAVRAVPLCRSQYGALRWLQGAGFASVLPDSAR